MKPLLALIAVTAVWDVTFVQVSDAVVVYPLFAFLAVRFALASVTFAPVGIVTAEPAAAGVLVRLVRRP